MDSPNFDFTLSAEYMQQYMDSHAEIRDDLMKDVDVTSTRSGNFEKEYTGFGDLAGGQMMHNKVQQIIKRCQNLNDVLHEAASKRDVDFTVDEMEHLDPDIVSTSMSDVHAFIRENAVTRVTRKSKR